MFIEIRTTLNTVVPEHREILKLLHQVGYIEEQQIRAQLEAAKPEAPTPGEPVTERSLFLMKDEVANGDEG